MRYRAGRFSGWTKAEIQQFEARWAAGTKQRRVFALVFQTGLRAFELTNLGLDGFRDGNFTVVLGGSKRLPALSD